MSFTYERSLRQNELRLLQPIALSHNSLSFRTRIIKRTDAHPYTAVSYTWGGDPPSQTIQLDGQTFSVRLNLWSCLYYVGGHAQKTSEGYLWVDAICINQDNIAERSAQVSRMDETYSNASFVAVWLGLAKLPEHVRYRIPRDEPIRTLDIGSFDFQLSMVDLANRPYWSRFWVIQEFLLGRDVIVFCGNAQRHWSYFKTILCIEARVLETGGMEQLNDRDGTQRMFKALPLVLGRHPDKHPEMLQPLYELLINHRKSICKDPRDRIFALLGLVKSEERSLLNKVFPDYKLSEDHVRIITLAHLMQWSRFELYYKPITPESTEIFQGLGVKTVAERKRLIRRAGQLDYLGIEMSHEVQRKLAFYDEMELTGGVGSQDLELEESSVDLELEESGVELETRSMTRRVVVPLIVFIAGTLLLVRLLALDHQHRLQIK